MTATVWHKMQTVPFSLSPAGPFYVGTFWTLLSQVLILVEDTNDNSPIFTSLPTESVLVKENQEPGKIATFKANDRDSGAFGQVRIR